MTPIIIFSIFGRNNEVDVILATNKEGYWCVECFKWYNVIVEKNIQLTKRPLL